MMQVKQEYPLLWPVGYKRTPSSNIYYSRFRQSLNSAQAKLKKEVKSLNGLDLIISTNIRVRRSDGDFYATDLNKTIDDAGVAIYFKYGKKDVAMCCDKYKKVWENIYALARSLQAIRQIARDGVSDFIERSFTGFAALPEAGSIILYDIWDELGLVTKPDNVETVKAAYRIKAKTKHPDQGGSDEDFARLNDAYQRALKMYE